MPAYEAAAIFSFFSHHEQLTVEEAVGEPNGVTAATSYADETTVRTITTLVAMDGNA